MQASKYAAPCLSMTAKTRADTYAVALITVELVAWYFSFIQKARRRDTGRVVRQRAKEGKLGRLRKLTIEIDEINDLADNPKIVGFDKNLSRRGSFEAVYFIHNRGRFGIFEPRLIDTAFGDGLFPSFVECSFLDAIIR